MKWTSFIMLNIITLVCVFLSCGDVDFNNTNDQFSNDYIRDNNAALVNLEVSEGTLSPVFDADVTEYSVEAPYLVDAIGVIPSAAGFNTSIAINDTPVGSGVSSDPISLDVGDNVILVSVTAEDGLTSQDYMITVARLDESSINASLAGLSVSIGELDPVFDENIIEYSVVLLYSVTYLTVTPTSAGVNAGIRVNDMPVSSGNASNIINLEVGDNTVMIEVTAEDGLTIKTYTISVTRMLPSSNASLSGLIISEGSLDPAFNENITTYIVDDVYEISITVTPVASYNFAIIFVNGISISSGKTSGPISLDVGENDVIIEVVAEDMLTIKTYTITVIRIENSEKDFLSFDFLSADNAGYLTADAIGIINTGLATINLTVPLVTDVTALVASFTVSDRSTVDVNGASQISGTTENDFTNSVIYRITTEDTTSKDYTVTVKRGKHEAYLKSPNNSNGDYFGDSVSISGDTIVVGAYREASTTTTIINSSNLSITNNSGSSNGAAYVFRRSDSAWSHEAYLKSPNNSNSDYFGDSVSISGDTIVVGAYREDSTTTTIINGTDLSTTNNSGSSNGAVYVFRRSGSAWSHEAYLKSPNNSNSDLFGNSVSISGDTIAVGAYGEDSTTTTIINGTDLSTTNNSGSSNGAVYVFRRSGSAWSHEAYLKSPNNSNSDLFGNSVSISGDTIAVGAYGEDSTTTAIINGSDLSSTNDDGVLNGAVYIFR